MPKIVFFVFMNEFDALTMTHAYVNDFQYKRGFYHGDVWIEPYMLCDTPAEALERLSALKREVGIPE